MFLLIVKLAFLLVFCTVLFTSTSGVASTLKNDVNKKRISEIIKEPIIQIDEKNAEEFPIKFTLKLSSFNQKLTIDFFQQASKSDSEQLNQTVSSFEG
jgi:hypothetical protein